MKQKIKLNKQYGIVNKNVLQNKNISIKAKGLYVYLAARSGNKGCCNPTVSTICSDLHITENSFYKYKNELLSANIITIKKTGTGIHKRNTYILPKLNKGYGFVFLDVLTNKHITLQAKAIYGLISCYAGARFVAFPSAKLVYSFLNIARNTYFNLLKILKQFNIVATKQLHINGRFAHCNFYINGAKPNNTNNRYIFKFTHKLNKRNKIFNTTHTPNNNNNTITKHLHNIEYAHYTQLVHDNINYNALHGTFSNDKYALHLLTQITDIITNTLYTGSKDIAFNGFLMNASIVQAIFNKLEFKHIKLVINNIIHNPYKINNLTTYLRVCLLNAFYQLNNLDNNRRF